MSLGQRTFFDEAARGTVQKLHWSTLIMEEDNTLVEVDLPDLPEALDVATYTRERHVLLIDNKEFQGARFLRYQRGSYLQAARQEDVQPETLRKALVGGLQHGGWFVMAFGSLETNLQTVFSEEMFPNFEQLMDRRSLYLEEVHTPLLRPDAGDPTPQQFVARDEFKLIFVTDKDPPQEGLQACTRNFQVIKLKNADEDVGAAASGAGDGQFKADSQLASMFGVKLVKRNSADMVEEAFDGNMEQVKEWLEKGYDLESVDGHENTSLGEAAAQGHDDLVGYLLDLGADPNTQNDQGRSPLFRASFNGHDSTVILLLNSGGDPDLKAQGAEAPTHVAKTEELRARLDAWDRNLMEELKAERLKIIRAKMEERLSTAAEKEALARDLIRKSLVKYAKTGNIEELKSEIERCVMEAEREGARTCRGSVACRDDRGQTLLMVAAQEGQLEMVKFLLHHWETIEDDIFGGGATMEKRAFRSNVNCRDSKGWTPVSVAAFHAKKDVLKELLAAGGNPLIPNVYKKNAFQVVETRTDLLGAVLKEGNDEILEVLNSWRAEKKKEDMGFVEESETATNNATEGGEAAATPAGPKPAEKASEAKGKTKGAKKGGKKGGKKKAAGATGKKSPAGSGAKAARALSNSPNKQKKKKG
jgi:ankyrin repeat protein